MPNICLGYLTVRGYKDNVDEFTKILKADYNYNTMEFTHKPHFFRVFEAEITDESLKGVDKTVSYNIECAWSIASCMMDDSPLCYYNTVKKDFDEFYGTTLRECAKKLNLFIEVESEEYGMGFTEYIKYNNFGSELNNECDDLLEYDLNSYDSVEDFNTKENHQMDQQDFNYYIESNDGCYAEYPDKAPTIDSMVYPIKVIMCKKREV